MRVLDIWNTVKLVGQSKSRV